MVDKALVSLDDSSKEKVLVTMTSKAFSQLIFKNCFDEWIAAGQ